MPNTMKQEHEHPTVNSCKHIQNLEERLACLVEAGPDAIDQRLRELEQACTAGRATKAMLGMLAATGLGMSALHSKKWLWLPAIGSVMSLQYLVSRNTFLGSMLHNCGFPLGSEIDQERIALKIIRGDFKSIPTLTEIENKEEIGRFENEGGPAVEWDEVKVDSREAARDAVKAALHC